MSFIEMFFKGGNLVFTILFIGWGIFSGYYIYQRKKSENIRVSQYVYDSIPSVFTTLGILGTFVGIFLGLQKFDVQNINKSIPPLLEGMKTAFLSSIIGIILSIIFGKISQITAEKSEKKYTAEEVEDELSAMKSILKELQKSNLQSEKYFENLNKSLENINDSIASEKHTSLASIMSKLRSEQNDNLAENIQYLLQIKEVMQQNATKVEEKFDDFSTLLAKNNTEALVEVMKSVTEEFNKQMSSLINKLVQENFEELNRSVNNLNIWQQENKEMIGTLTTQFSQVSNDFSISATAIKEISINTKQLTDENSYLSRLIQELQKVMINDSKFEKITTKLTNTIDTLHNNTNTFAETTNKLNNWVKTQMDFVDSVAVLIKRLEDVKNIKDINEIFWENFEHQLTTSMSKIEKASDKLKEDLDSINDEFYDQLNDVLTNFDNALQRIMTEKGF